MRDYYPPLRARFAVHERNCGELRKQPEENRQGHLISNRVHYCTLAQLSSRLPSRGSCFCLCLASIIVSLHPAAFSRRRYVGTNNETRLCIRWQEPLPLSEERFFPVCRRSLPGIPSGERVQETGPMSEVHKRGKN